MRNCHSFDRVLLSTNWLSGASSYPLLSIWLWKALLVRRRSRIDELVGTRRKAWID